MEATESAAGSSGRRRARTIIGAGVVILILILILVVVGWLGLSTQRASLVHVLLPADALSCEGTTVDVGDVPSVYGDDVSTPLAEIAEDMRCRLDIRIENRSSSDAIIRRIFLPVLGPEGGPGVEAVALDGVGIEPREDEVDAIFDLEPALRVPAESAETFGISLVSREDGCTGEGMTISFPEQPTVTVSVLGRDHERSFTGTGFGFRGSSFADCSQ